MQMLSVASLDEIGGFPRSKWGIPEPPDDVGRDNALCACDLDLVILPGVAFDINCNRLGHGGGYYGV